MTDTHAQLLPVYFREPSVNIGVGAMAGQPPHLVGDAFLKHFGFAPGSPASYAFTFLDYQDAAHRYGRMGGFAHLKTLVDRLRGDAGAGNSLLLDGGDLWQGSGLADVLQGADMVEGGNLLGIEAMTGHWEFTYGEKILRQQIGSSRASLSRKMFFSPMRPPSIMLRHSTPRPAAYSSRRRSSRSAAIELASSAKPCPMSRSLIRKVYAR